MSGSVLLLGATSKRMVVEEHPEWAIQNRMGNPIVESGESWLCPRLQVQDYRLSVMEDLVTRYDVRGINLDYVRYPHLKGCFCPLCREELRREYAEDLLELNIIIAHL